MTSGNHPPMYIIQVVDNIFHDYFFSERQINLRKVQEWGNPTFSEATANLLIGDIT